MLFAGDGQWWDHFRQRVKAGEWPDFSGEKWTTSAKATQAHGLNYLRPQSGEGISNDRVFTGGNSGYQLLGAVRLFGVSRIVLLGYDMQRTGGKKHWHADHPDRMGNGTMHHKWAERFDRLAPKLAALGVDVLNATRETALRGFRRVSLSEALT